MNKLLFLLFFLIISCQNRSDLKRETKNAGAYIDLQKAFSVDIEAARLIYVKWYMQKFNIDDARKVKGSHELIIDDAYFYCYVSDKKTYGILLSGVTINGFNGEVKEINLGVRVVKTNSGYKELKTE